VGGRRPPRPAPLHPWFNDAGQKNKQKKKKAAEAKGAQVSKQQGGGESGTVEVGGGWQYDVVSHELISERD